MVSVVTLGPAAVMMISVLLAPLAASTSQTEKSRNKIKFFMDLID